MMGSTWAIPENTEKPIDSCKAKQRVYITMRLASLEEIPTRDDFMKKYPDDVTSLVSYWQGTNADDKLDEIYNLVCRYGKSVMDAATRMRNKFDNLSLPVNPNSLLGIISARQYMKSPIFNRVAEIDTILKKAIPDIFQREKPKNENDFNDKLHGLLNVHSEFTREYPVLLFGLSSYKADQAQGELIVESKYVRGNVPPSVASEGIAADITKIPDGYGVLFAVYDPEHKITDDEQFAKAYEDKRIDCYVRIYR